MLQSLKQATVLFLLFFVADMSAQTKALDSMYARLASHPEKDTERVKTLLRIADRITSSNPDKALKLTDEAQQTATSIGDNKGKAYSLLYACNAEIAKGNWQSGLRYAQQSMAVFESLNNKYGKADCFHNYGRCHFYLGNYDKAISNYKIAIGLGEETGDLGRQSGSWNALGIIYQKQGEFDDAIDAYQRALKIDEKQKDNAPMVSTDLISIGGLMMAKGDYAPALEYYFRALELKTKLGDERAVASIQSNIGNVYSELKKLPEAMEYLNDAAEFWKKIGNRDRLAATYANMAVVYMNGQKYVKSRELFNDALSISTSLKDQFSIGLCHTNLGTLDMLEDKYESALTHFGKAVAIHSKLRNRKELSYDYLKMAKIYQLTKDYDKSLEYADKGAAIAQSLGLLNYLKDFSLVRSEVYFAKEDYKLAYENQARHKMIMDSLLKADVYNNVADVKYSNVYKEKLNSSATRESSLKQEVQSKTGELESSQQQKIWWIVGVLCLLVVLGFVLAIVKIRKAKMENKQLLTEQKLRRSQMNPHFIFNSLQNVRSLIHNNQEADAVNYLNRFSKLTRQILESSDQNYTSLEEEIELIKNYISIQQLLYNHTFDFEINIDENIDEESIFLPPMLTQPFIENAIKHGLAAKENNGMLVINFTLKDEKLLFEVSDNGAGFSDAKKDPNHKSMAMDITRERLANYTKNPDFVVQSGNILDTAKNIVGAKVAFEIPYIYEN